jgi:hypothetical protein
MPHRDRAAAAVRTRLLYACDYFFGGDLAAFARVLGIRSDSFRVKLRNRAPSLDLVIRVAQKTNICLEWLLFGTGPIVKKFDAELEAADIQPFVLAHNIKTAYPIFTEFAPVDVITPRPVVRYPDVVPSSAATRIAKAIYSAQAAGKPVLLFADAPAARTCRKLIVRLLRQNSLACLAYTGRALEEEILTDAITLKVPIILRLGAQSGIGFGEAAQRWGGITKLSPVWLARRHGVPFAAHVSVGEMASDLSEFSGAADTGAALGACAYVDALVLAGSIRRLLEAGGVFLALAPITRVLEWLPAICKRVVPPEPVTFSVIFFGTRPRDVACDSLHSVGGTAHFLEGDPAHTAEAVRLACVKIFDGKTDDDEDDSTSS